MNGLRILVSVSAILSLFACSKPNTARAVNSAPGQRSPWFGIVGGKVDQSDSAAKVVLLEIDDPDGKVNCSGVVIGSRTVLTARRCAFNKNGPRSVYIRISKEHRIRPSTLVDLHPRGIQIGEESLAVLTVDNNDKFYSAFSLASEVAPLGNRVELMGRSPNPACGAQKASQDSYASFTVPDPDDATKSYDVAFSWAKLSPGNPQNSVIRGANKLFEVFKHGMSFRSVISMNDILKCNLSEKCGPKAAAVHTFDEAAGDVVEYLAWAQPGDGGGAVVDKAGKLRGIIYGGTPSGGGFWKPGTILTSDLDENGQVLGTGHTDGRPQMKLRPEAPWKGERYLYASFNTSAFDLCDHQIRTVLKGAVSEDLYIPENCELPKDTKLRFQISFKNPKAAQETSCNNWNIEFSPASFTIENVKPSVANPPGDSSNTTRVVTGANGVFSAAVKNSPQTLEWFNVELTAQNKGTNVGVKIKGDVSACGSTDVKPMDLVLVVPPPYIPKTYNLANGLEISIKMVP